MSAPVREAIIFCKLLETLPLHIHDGDLFAGWFGYETQEEREALYSVPPIPRTPIDETAPVELIRRHGYNPTGYDRAHHELDYRYLLEKGVAGRGRTGERRQRRAQGSVFAGHAGSLERPGNFG